jgi:hypothetical protein
MIFFGELAVTVRVHTGSNSNMQARRRLGGQEEAQQEESRKSRSQRRSPLFIYTFLRHEPTHFGLELRSSAAAWESSDGVLGRCLAVNLAVSLHLTIQLLGSKSFFSCHWRQAKGCSSESCLPFACDAGKLASANHSPCHARGIKITTVPGNSFY